MRSLRIFVVENHADTLRWLTVYLQECGHTVGSARTIAEAVSLMPHQPWDVLISDIGLPDGSGWDLLEQLHISYPILAIAMSGFGSNADTVRSRVSGFHHHLVKPLKIKELDALLEKAASNLKLAVGHAQ